MAQSGAHASIAPASLQAFSVARPYLRGVHELYWMALLAAAPVTRGGWFGEETSFETSFEVSFDGLLSLLPAQADITGMLDAMTALDAEKAAQQMLSQQGYIHQVGDTAFADLPKAMQERLLQEAADLKAEIGTARAAAAALKRELQEQQA